MSKVFYDEIHKRANSKVKEQNFVQVPNDRASWLKWVEIYFQSAFELRDHFDECGLLNSSKAFEAFLQQEKKMLKGDELEVFNRLNVYELNVL